MTNEAGAGGTLCNGLRDALRQGRPDVEAVAREARALLVSLAECAASGASADADLARGLELLGEVLRDTRLSEDAGAALPIEAFERIGEALTARLPEDAPEPEAMQRAAWYWLDLVRRPSVARRLGGDDDRALRETWLTRMIEVGELSRLTIGQLLGLRAQAYGPRTFLRVPSRGNEGRLSWLAVATEVDRIAKGMILLERELGGGPIAILSENRYEMALVDLACLGTGVVNVMIPAHTTETDVGYILGMTHARAVVVSTDEQLHKVQRHRSALPQLERIVILDEPSSHVDGLITLGDLITRGRDLRDDELAAQRWSVRYDDLATLMVTSGTTGKPKAIRFTQRNLITKRFARGLALPEIGDQDVFLCYLPLFHTFGRYLEMLGCLYWGATYVFLEDPSREGLVNGFREFEPSVFISIPMKWLQLHEEIGRGVDFDEGSDEEILGASRTVIGKRLRFGLSAAGYLPAEVFRFFQRQGVELMSGFGMTEATGGITMTPPGRYRDDTLGLALPGIDLRLDDEGELEMRGCYVMDGYADKDGSIYGIDEEGWVKTGDLMQLDEAGYLRIVDRKKEIYKNIKGETIAPQRIENLFRDFGAIGRVFLVGDHREYNTVLIVPNDAPDSEIAGMNEEEQKAHFRSLVVSVNSFLAPFERIVDFALLERDFSADEGELTPKGTYRRKVIADHFDDVIGGMYRRTRVRIEGAALEVEIPNWVYQVFGLTAGDVTTSARGLYSAASGKELVIAKRASEDGGRVLQIGSMLYRLGGRYLDLGAMISAPGLWLGNDALVAFTRLEEHPSVRQRRRPSGIERVGRAMGYAPAVGEDEALRDVQARESGELADLHLAGKLLGARDERIATAAVRTLAVIVRRFEARVRLLALGILRSASTLSSLRVRRQAFRVLAVHETEPHARATVRTFLDIDEVLLDEGTIAHLCEKQIPQPVLAEIVALLAETVRQERSRDEAQERHARIMALTDLLASYGSAHPGTYKQLRCALARMESFAPHMEDREAAERARERMQDGFRRWLGPSQRIAVDPETGEEYRWEDVVTLEEGMLDEDRHRLLGLIRGTSFVREAVFLFAGRSIRLSDIPLGGVWVSLVAEKNGKAVYRVTIHTRFQGSYDIAVNLNRELPAETVRSELLCLIVAGEEREGQRLVEDFGGYWRQYDLWSEEFVAGETIDRFLRRLSRERNAEGEQRMRAIWPFVVWSAAEAYLDFWERTGRRQMIAEPALANVIVPTHDFQVGARIVSVTNREPFTTLESALIQFWGRFVEPIEREHACLEGVARGELLLSALVEAVGEEEGVAVLQKLSLPTPALAERAARFLERIEQLGFVPKRLHFAIARYHRWAALNRGATAQARARTIHDLFETYNLASLLPRYPEARVRFFRETAFLGAPEEFRQGLDDVIARLRSGPVEADALIEAIGELRQFLAEGSDEEYFLTRLSYPHLRPGDTAELFFTEHGGTRQADVVVTLEDTEGRSYRVRQPVNPKEVGRLHRLFLANKLEVTFRSEHHYLVAIGPRGNLIGGLFYEVDEEDRRAHLEKIVVAERVRKHGISDGLMTELFNRLRASGMTTITTGFFKPSYFYRFGFTIEKGYAGLVKELAKVDTSATTAE